MAVLNRYKTAYLIINKKVFFLFTDAPSGVGIQSHTITMSGTSGMIATPGFNYRNYYSDGDYRWLIQVTDRYVSIT